ncbi:MAG: VPLPA-CTERM sorting domain-containing protein [Desulfobacteraceae bacterium]|nr:VPLPA-CTERM sorting domain-containing protein [Desulfobacteraceae bacterium]
MKIKAVVLSFVTLFLLSGISFAGSYAPAAGQPGSTAIFKDDPSFAAWATGVDLVRGLQDISNPSGPYASYGTPEVALGKAGDGVVSLGDGGSATLTFDAPIANGDGYDFAVFENSFSDTFLELGFVEVSSDGENFFRFDAVSETQTGTQVGGFGNLDTTNLNNFAGKYKANYGTGFDLEELSGIRGLDIFNIGWVRIIDVVGSIDDAYATCDSFGNKVNDPWKTPFGSSGFDLDAVGVINQGSPVPVPAAVWLLGSGLVGLVGLRRKNN